MGFTTNRESWPMSRSFPRLAQGTALVLSQPILTVVPFPRLSTLLQSGAISLSHAANRYRFRRENRGNHLPLYAVDVLFLSKAVQCLIRGAEKR